MSDLTIEQVREATEQDGFPQISNASRRMLRFLLTEIDRLQARVEELEKALRALHNACLKADVYGELYEFDGSLLDNARTTLDGDK